MGYKCAPLFKVTKDTSSMLFYSDGLIFSCLYIPVRYAQMKATQNLITVLNKIIPLFSKLKKNSSKQ
jgi:hypothetical protein